MSDDKDVAHYDSSYQNFASDLYAAIRLEVFGEDIGQNGWLTAEEQDLFISWLALEELDHFLDVACGSGGPTLRIVEKTRSIGLGIDMHQGGISAAREQAAARSLTARAAFEQLDASRPLPFEDGTFDGLICIDAVNHLPDRPRIFSEWARVVKPGGRLVFTDPITITGPISKEEIRIRSSIGYFLFVPSGIDQQLLEEAGFAVRAAYDRTENMARMAARWFTARQERAADLRLIEGDETFEGQQIFFQVAATLARERRLSRFAFQAVRR